MSKLTPHEVDVLTDIHHQAEQIQHHVVLCLANKRIGREWLLKMKHSHERLDLLIGRINNEQ